MKETPHSNSPDETISETIPPELAQGTLDALSAHIAIVNSEGVIVAVNRSWKRFGKANGYAQDNGGVGTNYLSACLPADQTPSDDAVGFAAGLKSILAAELDSFEMEYPCDTLEGEMWFNASITLFPGDGPRYVAVAHEDITARKETEKQLELTQFAVDHLKDPTYWAGESGQFIYVNHSAVATLGYPRDELLQMHVWDVDPDVSKEIWADQFKGFKEQGTIVFEGIHRKKDGTRFPVEITGNYIKFGEMELVCGFVHDISERKKAQRELEESRRFLRTIIDSAPVRIFWKDHDSVFLGCNAPLANDVGLEHPEQIIGKTDFDIGVTKKQAERFRADDRAVIDSGMPKLGYEEPRTQPDGTLQWIRTNKIPLTDQQGRMIGVLGTYEDITDQRRMKEAIEKRIVALTRPLDDVQGIAFDELFDLAEIQRIQDDFSEATCVASIITYPDGTPITKPSNFTRLCFEVIRKTEKGCANCFRSDAELGKSTPEGPNIQMCLSGGLWDAGASITVGGKHIANWLIGQVRNESQTEDAMLAYAREIGADETDFMDAFHEVPKMPKAQFDSVAQALFTLANQLSTSAYQNIQQARFIAEESRRTAELRRLSTAIEQSPEVIMITDIKGNIQYVNPIFETTSGYTRDEAIGQNPRILKSGRQGHAFYKNLWKTIASGNIWKGRLVNRRKDGRLYTEERTIAPVKDASGKVSNYVAVGRDISQELLREEEYRQSQKMDAIGQLAGGVAHDFNNILQGIQGFAELLEISLEKGSVNHANICEIRKASHRAAELTQQLLSFSRKKPYNAEELDLNAVLQGTEPLLQILLGGNHVLVLELDDDLPKVMADQGHLTQIIMNLSVNARDAMEEGGRLTIATSSQYLSEDDTEHIPEAIPGSYAVMSFTDTGCGISKEKQLHIFEPFYTTKEVGKGTGLGLSVVYGMVKQHSGWINIYSEIDKGTCFRVHFSTAVSLDPSASSDTALDTPPMVLLVEDDPEVSDMILESLSKAGCDVETAESAEEGLKLFLQNKARIGLLISDMELPGMHGGELADEIRAEDPDLPVLLISGYPDYKNRWKGLEKNGYLFISKPFTGQHIVSAIKEILQGT